MEKIDKNSINEQEFYNLLDSNEKKIFTKYKNIYEIYSNKNQFFSFIVDMTKDNRKKLLFLKLKGIWKIWLNKLVNKLNIILQNNDKKGEIQEKTTKNIENNFQPSFEEIYDNFDIKNPLENPYIEDILLTDTNMKNNYNKFIDFCNFLLNKINIAKKKKEVEKIPYIISNLSSFKKRWYTTWKNNKKAEIMKTFHKKFSPLRKDITL